jgi:hypothetical protein
MKPNAITFYSRVLISSPVFAIRWNTSMYIFFVGAVRRGFRVTRLGEFSPLRDSYITLGNFVKNSEVA